MQNDISNNKVKFKEGHNEWGNSFLYKEEDYIGRGELGAIYKVSSDSRLVVKVPHNSAKGEQTKAEFQLLKAIAEEMEAKERNITVPRVALGVLEHKQLPVIIMPYYDDQKLLTKAVHTWIKEGNLLTAEKIALEAVIDFLYVMCYFPEGKACTDRKIKDFYYIDEKTTVIDWNVLRVDSPALRISEIRLLGFLVHELFLERKGVTPFEPFDDSNWVTFSDYKKETDLKGEVQNYGVISVGLRWLLSQIVKFQPNAEDNLEREELYKSLIKVFEAWKDLIASPRSDVNSFVQVTSQFFAGSVNDDVKAAIEKDLIWRRAPNDTSLFERQDAIKQAYQLQGLDAIRGDIDQAIERDPSNAQGEIEDKINQAENSKDWVIWGHLKRWDLLLEFIGKINEDNSLNYQERRDLERRIISIGRGLFVDIKNDDQNKVSLQKLKSDLDDIPSRYPNAKYLDDLKPVEIELAIRNKQVESLSWRRLKSYFLDIGNGLKELKDHPYIIPPEDTNGETIETLASQLFRHYLMYEFIEDVRKFVGSNTETEDALLSKYGVILAVAEISDEADWIDKELRPLKELVCFVNDYEVHNENLLASMLEQVVKLYKHYGKRLGENLGYEWDNRLKGIVQDYIDNALKSLEEQNYSHDLAKATRIYNLLKRYENNDVINSYYPIKSKLDNEYAKDYLRDIYFYDSWYKTLAKFNDKPNKENAQSLLEVLNRYEGGDAVMSAFDPLNENPEPVKGVLDANIQSMREAVEAAIKEAGGLKIDLDNKLKAVKGEVNEFNKKMGGYQYDFDKFSNEQDSLKEQIDSKREEVNNAFTELKKLGGKDGLLKETYARYWPVSGKGTHDSGESSGVDFTQLDAETKNIREIIQNLPQRLNAGAAGIDEALNRLREKSNDTLTSLLINEIVNTWQVRVDTYKILEAKLKDITNHSSNQLTKPEEILGYGNRLILEMKYFLDQCPVDVFSKALHKQFIKIIDVEKANLPLSMDLKGDLRKVFRESLEEVKANLERLKQEADNKNKAYNKVFSANAKGAEVNNEQ